MWWRRLILTFSRIVFIGDTNDDSDTLERWVYLCAREVKNEQWSRFLLFLMRYHGLLLHFLLSSLLQRESKSLLLLCLLFCFVIITQNFWTQSTEFMVFCDPESPFAAYISQTSLWKYTNALTPANVCTQLCIIMQSVSFTWGLL